MKILNITKIINQCYDCPNRFHGFDCKDHECLHVSIERTVIPSPYTIPNFCPLKDIVKDEFKDAYFICDLPKGDMMLQCKHCEGSFRSEENKHHFEIKPKGYSDGWICPCCGGKLLYNDMCSW